MRKNYVKPALISEEFVPQTYVAACGDETVTWSIKCNVPRGFGFLDNNSNNIFDTGDTYLVEGNGCDEYHEGVTLPKGQTPTANAKWQKQKWQGGLFGQYVNDGNPIDVFYWEAESWGHDPHHFSLVEEGDWHKENLS